MAIKQVHSIQHSSCNQYYCYWYCSSTYSPNRDPGPIVLALHRHTTKRWWLPWRVSHYMFAFFYYLRAIWAKLHFWRWTSVNMVICTYTPTHFSSTDFGSQHLQELNSVLCQKSSGQSTGRVLTLYSKWQILRLIWCMLRDKHGCLQGKLGSAKS